MWHCGHAPLVKRACMHAIRGTATCSGGRVAAVAGGGACSHPVKGASNRVDASIECCYDDCCAFLPVERENAPDTIIWLFNIACEHLDELGQRSVRHQ